MFDFSQLGGGNFEVDLIGGGGGGGASPLPMSFNDPIFAAAVTAPTQSFGDGDSIVDKTFTNATGNQQITWLGNGGTANVTRCRFDCREGIRVQGGNGGTLNVDQCWIEVAGLTDDHADGLQCFGSPPGTLNLSNTTFRCYRDGEVHNIPGFGPSTVGAVGLFWADGYYGTLRCQNVLFWGGQFGCRFLVDANVGHLDFHNVYFVGPFTFDGFNTFIGTGASIVVDQWVNVVNATIVGGVIVPGSPIPSP